MKKAQSPLPLFDSIEYFDKNDFQYLTDSYFLNDIKIAVSFLKSYKEAQGTFNSYRREIERLLHWSALILQKPLNELRRNDIESFIKFCQKTS